MIVLLPDELHLSADGRAVDSSFDSGGDYVGDLFHRDGEYAGKLTVLQAAMDAGPAPGVSERDPLEYLKELRVGCGREPGNSRP